MSVNGVPLRTAVNALGLLLAATITFLSPQNGSQAIGPFPLEITTTATNVDRVEFSVDGKLAGVARKAPWRIAYDFGTSLDSHRISVKVFSNRFQTVETGEVTTASMGAGETLDVDVVEVPVRLRASRTLTAADLRVKESGVAQTIRDLKSTRGPAHFAFVIDRSNSMDDGRLEAALRAVDSGRKLLRPDDTVSVVFFNHHVTKSRRVERGESLVSLSGEIVPSGGTSLRDAVASTGGRDRTYVIAITDGGDRNSELNQEMALRRISGAKTVVDAIVLGTRSSFLDRAARNTGGEIVSATAATLERALRGLIEDINGRYLLVYQSAGTKKGWRTIDVAAAKGGVSIVNARKGYYAQ